MASRKSKKKVKTSSWLARWTRNLLLLLIALAMLAAGGMYYWATTPQTKPASGYVLLQEGSVRQLAHSLKLQQGINSSQLFVLLARMTGNDSRLKPGRYKFDTDLSPLALMDKMVKGDTDDEMFTIIEGTNWRQLKKAMAANPLLRHDTGSMSDTEVLAKLEIDASSPEGLFFPETYHIEANSSDLKLLARAHKLLVKKLDGAWANRSPDLPLEKPYDLLILASLVEKETGLPQDRPMIAGVFANRLKAGMRLQTDPAVIYGVGEAYTGNLTKAHLTTDTPYNTYTRAGLPPSPIAMVGEAALAASSRPAITQAKYFVSRGDGSSEFSNTLDQHNAAVRKFILNK